MGSEGQEIMRKGENLIIEMLVSQGLTQKQDEKDFRKSNNKYHMKPCISKAVM